MNYTLTYLNLIAKAQQSQRNKTSAYYELHHIVPRCLGGLDTPENLVLLTAREHYLAHALLWRARPTSSKLALAFFMMANVRGKKIPARQYERLKIAAHPLIKAVNARNSKFVTANRLGIHSRAPDLRLQDSRLGGTRARDLKAGIHAFSLEQRQEASRRAGNKGLENKSGIHAQTLEERQNLGYSSLAEQTGINQQTKNERASLGMRNGLATLAQGIGIHAQTKVDKQNSGRKGAATISARSQQTWKDSLEALGLHAEFQPTREQAKAWSLRYFWGKECEHCSNSKRYLSTGHCVNRPH